MGSFGPDDSAAESDEGRSAIRSTRYATGHYGESRGGGGRRIGDGGGEREERERLKRKRFVNGRRGRITGSAGGSLQWARIRTDSKYSLKKNPNIHHI
jgi:hypothetical protein